MMSSVTGKFLLLAFAAAYFPTSKCDGNGREHKVHNIVLYPERHSWCTTTPIKQIVALPGFEPVTIDNNVCVGACYSYSIPRTQPAEPGELIGPYCDSCQPKETQCYHVTLKSSTKTIQKRVQIITNCTCSTCGTQLDTTDCDLTDVNTSELPTNLRSMKDNQDAKPDVPEVPELLTVGSAPIANSSDVGHAHHAPAARTYRISGDVRGLLDQIQALDADEDEDEALSAATVASLNTAHLQQLLEVVEGGDGKLSDKDVMEFVNYVNEHLDLDLDSLKLKSTLHHFKEVQYLENLRQRHRNFGLGMRVQDPIEQIDDIPIITGIEGSRIGLGHKKGAHIGMGMKTHHISDNTISDDNGDVEMSTQRHESHSHHHKIGEEQHILGGVGHLVMGPHGSLVVAPGEAKLSLASDEVSPNQEGLVIDYHHHGHHAGHHGGGHGHDHTKHNLEIESHASQRSVEEIVSHPVE